MASRYDVVVIGSGTGGYVAAIRAAQLGLSTAVVERQPVLGGTCLNWGCIPTKALLEHAHALKVVQQAADWGVTTGATAAPAIAMDVVHARKDRIVASLTKGVEYLFRKHRIAWIKGSARLGGGGDVDVTGDAPRSI
jgi:dihydrolipoamide dehydrogenase